MWYIITNIGSLGHYFPRSDLSKHHYIVWVYGRRCVYHKKGGLPLRVHTKIIRSDARVMIPINNVC